MIQYPDGHEVPLRSGATGSVDPESRIGPGNVGWDAATVAVHDAGHAWRQVMGERREREASDESSD